METKIKRIEELLAGWKASKKSWEETSCPESVLQATWMIKGMELALRVLQEPSNDVNTPDVCKCGEAKDIIYCGKCNKVWQVY